MSVRAPWLFALAVAASKMMVRLSVRMALVYGVDEKTPLVSAATVDG